MSWQEEKQQITSIREMIEQKTTHHYLHQFIGKPSIDEDYILLLMSSLDGAGMTESDVEKYVTTAMLVQLALDTHENVNDQQQLHKERQLTVLAGDYYSGLYYKMLSTFQDVSLIRSLAGGIQSVNEHKILVYQLDCDNMDTFLSSLKEIEAAIINKFSLHFNVQQVHVFASEFLLLKRLLLEKQAFIQEKKSILFQAIKKFLLPKLKVPLHQLSVEQRNRMVRICDQYIYQAKDALATTLESVQCMPPLLERRIGDLMKQAPTETKLFAEEG